MIIWITHAEWPTPASVLNDAAKAGANQIVHDKTRPEGVLEIDEAPPVPPPPIDPDEARTKLLALIGMSDADPETTAAIFMAPQEDITALKAKAGL